MSARPPADVHVCPSCERSVLVTVPAVAWCTTCGERMRIVGSKRYTERRPRKRPGNGEGDT